MYIDLNLTTFLLIYSFLVGIIVINHLLGKNNYKLFYKLLIAFYFLSLFKVTMLGLNVNLSGISHHFASDYMQLVPFGSILDICSSWTKFSHNWLQIVGNIILLMPLAIFVSIKTKYQPKETLKICLASCLLIEMSQLLIDIITQSPSRIFDVDDIILNMLGVIIIISISKLLNKQKVNKLVLKKDLATA